MRTFLFDFDGTLVDSMSTIAACMLRILDDNGIPYGDDLIKTIIPLGFNGTAEHFIKMGLSLPKEEILALMEKYMVQAYTYSIPPKSGVVGVLHVLKEQGADLNVLTASPHIILDPCMKRLGLFDLFTNVWSCDDFGTTKYDPEIYKMAAQKLGKPVQDVLFVDDNLGANKTAKAAGMVACGIYDDASKEYVEEMKAVADYYIWDFAELLELFA